MKLSVKPANVLFIHGLPDNRQVSVLGYDTTGQVVYKWDGNTDFHSHINGAHFTKQYMSIIWFAEPDRTITRPDVVVNCINDPDIAGNSLAKAAQIIGSIQAKWPQAQIFNPPQRVMETTRDQIHARFSGLPGIYIPKVVRITPASAAEVLAAAEAMGFPLLMRPCGSHQSEGLVMLEDKESARAICERYAYDGSAYYLSEFVDYRSPDGLYRKARLIAMNGRLQARHFMTGETWMVHGDLHDEYMAFHPATRREEEAFIANFNHMIRKDALESLLTIARETGLDYLGYDIAVRPDGSLLIFEINPAQNSFGLLNPDVFPYMRQVRDTMVSALNQCILRKLPASRLQASELVGSAQ